MPTRPIKIINSNTTTGWLKLDDHGHTHAKAGDTILWQIANNSGVHSIVSIQEKSSSGNFWAAPPQPQGANWKGTILSTAPFGAEYVYSIIWRASEKGPELKHDPKISVRPSSLYYIVLNTVKIIIAVIIGIFTWKFWRKLRK